MKNWPQEEEEFVFRLSGIESLLDQLQLDFDSTTWRKSTIVASCIKKARKELKSSIDYFIELKLEESSHLANLAWLHVEFGRRLLDAETTEGLLGAGTFLELSEDTTTSKLLVKYFSRLEQFTIKLREKIKEQQKAAQK